MRISAFFQTLENTFELHRICLRIRSKFIFFPENSKGIVCAHGMCMHIKFFE